MKWNPAEDGISHINVYSRGKTEEGKWASNFQYAPFVHPTHGRFDSIEGLWYWLSVDPKNPRRDWLRFAAGAEAKNMGRNLRGKDWVASPSFEESIRLGLRAKFDFHPARREAFQKTTLPLAHYYVMGGRVKSVSDGQWILDELDAIRKGEPVRVTV
jgi:hypothetical protein